MVLNNPYLVILKPTKMMPLKLKGNKKRKPQISLRLCGSLLNSYEKEETFLTKPQNACLRGQKLMFAQFSLRLFQIQNKDKIFLQIKYNFPNFIFHFMDKAQILIDATKTLRHKTFYNKINISQRL